MSETELMVQQKDTQVMPVQFTRDQIELLKRTVAKDHTDDELALFMYFCRSKNLDPFAREVYSIKRAGKPTIQMGIDGLRSKAERTGEYGGQETYWCGLDGIWKDVWLVKDYPAAAKVVAYRKNTQQPFSGIARWDEYKPVDNDFMWKKMPANQLAKCAEALALRKAFPTVIGGIYATEEMLQATPMASQSSIEESPIANPQPAASTNGKPPKEKMRQMKSKMGTGKCTACGKFIVKDSEMYYDGNTRTAYHAECA